MEALQRNVQAVSQKQEVAELKTKGGRAQFGVLVDIKTHIDMAEAALRAAMGAPEKLSLDYFNNILQSNSLGLVRIARCTLFIVHCS